MHDRQKSKNQQMFNSLLDLAVGPFTTIAALAEAHLL
jgi:hypothetical protein